MKFLLQAFLTISIIGFLSCGQNPPEQSNNATSGTTDTSTTSRSLAALPDTQNCTLRGAVLEGNQFWIRERQILVAIVADSSTFDKNLEADGHRILEVYDTRDCSQLLRQTLPVDKSADFPYYIAKPSYNNVGQMLAVRGTTSIYVYDLANRKLSPKLSPQFQTKRDGMDAQSGMIQHLEVWENFLVGYAQDYGTFVFDMRDKQNVKAILPFGEYKISDGDFGSLFMLPSANNSEQGIMPAYDRNSSVFSVNPILNQPTAMDKSVTKSAKNNRYVVLRDASNNAIAVDLQARKRVELPADVASKPTQEVLQWVRKK